jgi:hypothetical protein
MSVEWLSSEGRKFGYRPELWYICPFDGQRADVAWMFKNTPLPLFTFTVKSQDFQKLTSEALIWLGSSTEPKTWMHVGIFTGGGTKQILSPMVQEDRIRILNSVEDTKSISSIFEKLNKSAMSLLERYSRVDPTNWPKEQPNRCETFPISISLDITIFTDEDSTVISPSSNILPLNIIIDKATVFDSTLFRLISVKESLIQLSTEHRNLPFIFNLEADTASGEGTLVLGFDADKSSIPQALIYQSMLEKYTEIGRLALTDQSGEVFAELFLPLDHRTSI